MTTGRMRDVNGQYWMVASEVNEEDEVRVEISVPGDAEAFTLLAAPVKDGPTRVVLLMPMIVALAMAGTIVRSVALND